MFVSRMNEVHELAIVSSENTKLESFGSNYLIVDPVEMYREGKAVLAPVGNQLYSFGDGDGEAVFVGKQSKGVFPDEELYSYEWAKFPNCKFFVQGPKKTIYAAGNPDQPLRVYISEPASKTSPIKDSPYSTEEPVIDAYGGLLSVVDILATNATEITALSSRGDQVVVHTNKGCHLLYAPTSDQAETGYRVEQAPATNFSAAVSSQVVAGETGSMSFWLGHDGQIYKDESASRGAEDVKNYADPAQVSWKSKSVWEKELHYDLRDSFAAYDRQSGMYWIYVLAPEYLDTIDDGIPGMVVKLEALPVRPGQITNLTAIGSDIPGNISDFDASTVEPGSVSNLIVLPRLPGKIEDFELSIDRPSYVTDLTAMPPKPGQVDLDVKPFEPGDIDPIDAIPLKPGNIEYFKCLKKPGTVEDLDAKPARPGVIDLELTIDEPGNIDNIDAQPKRPGLVNSFKSEQRKPGKVGTPGVSPEKPVDIISLTAKPDDPGRVTVFDVENERPGTVENVDAQTTTEKLSKPVIEMKVPEFMDPERMEFAVLWEPVENATYPEGYELELDKYESGQELFDPPEESYTPDTTGMYFTNMSPYTIYAARVRAVGHGHKYTTSDWSDVKTFQTPRMKLAAPNDLDAFFSVFNEDPAKDVTVVWTHNQLADMHQLQISTTSDFSTVLINHTQTSGPALFIEEEPGSRLSAETTYYLRLRCSGGNYATSDWTETIQYRTAVDEPAPHTVLNVAAKPVRPTTVTGLNVVSGGTGYLDPNDYAFDGAFFGTGRMTIWDNNYPIRHMQGSCVHDREGWPSFAPPTTPSELLATGDRSSNRMSAFYPDGRVNGAAKTVDYCRANPGGGGFNDDLFKIAPIAVTYEGLRDFNDIVVVNEYGTFRRRWRLTPQGTMPSWKIESFDYQGVDEEVWLVYDPNQLKYTVLEFNIISTYAGRDYYPNMYQHNKTSSYDQSFHPSNPFGVYSYHWRSENPHRTSFIFAPDFLDSCDPAHFPNVRPVAPVHITLPENSTLDGTAVTNLQVQPDTGEADSEQCEAGGGSGAPECSANNTHYWRWNGSSLVDLENNAFDLTDTLFYTHVRSGKHGPTAWNGIHESGGPFPNTQALAQSYEGAGDADTNIFWGSQPSQKPYNGGKSIPWDYVTPGYAGGPIFQMWHAFAPATVNEDGMREWEADFTAQASPGYWTMNRTMKLFRDSATGNMRINMMRGIVIDMSFAKNDNTDPCELTGLYTQVNNADYLIYVGLRPQNLGPNRMGAYHQDGSLFELHP